MILFQPEYNRLILSGKKKWTYRVGVRKFHIGSIQKCKNEIFSKNYFATIQIKKIILKSFGELDDTDARNDLFKNAEEMKRRLIELNGDIKPRQIMSGINFKRVG